MEGNFRQSNNSFWGKNKPGNRIQPGKLRWTRGNNEEIEESLKRLRTKSKDRLKLALKSDILTQK